MSARESGQILGTISFDTDAKNGVELEGRAELSRRLHAS